MNDPGTIVTRVCDGATAQDAVRMVVAAGWPCPPQGTAIRVAIVLDDLCDDCADSTVGAVVVDVVSDRVARLLGISARDDGRGAGAAGRLLAACGARLSARGVERLVVSVPEARPETLISLIRHGFAEVRHSDGRVDLRLDLQ